MKGRASEVETLEAWHDLLNAIQRVECALPSQMSAAILELIAQRRRFDNLMLGREPLSAHPAETKEAKS